MGKPTVLQEPVCQMKGMEEGVGGVGEGGQERGKSWSGIMPRVFIGSTCKFYITPYYSCMHVYNSIARF